MAEVGALEIVLKGGKPWGFSIHGGSEVWSPLVVSHIAEGGKAESEGGLQIGDLVLSINDIPCHSKAEAAQLVDSAFKTLTLEVWRGNLREQQRSENVLQQAQDVNRSRGAKDDSVVYTAKRPNTHGNKMKRNESFSVGQKRPSNWQRNQRENLKNYQHIDFKKTSSSATLPADYPPTYPSGSLTPDDDDVLLQTAPAALQASVDRINESARKGFPSSKSASNIERDTMRQTHNYSNPRPYSGPKPYQSMSAINTAGLDNIKKPGSVYEKLSNTGLDFSPKKQQNPKSEGVRHMFSGREKGSRITTQQYGGRDSKNNTFLTQRDTYHHDNYVNIPAGDEKVPPIPPLPQEVRMGGGPPPPARNSSFRNHGKFPSWPVEGSQVEPTSGPIDTPPVRDYTPSDKQYNSLYQPGLHTVNETRSPVAPRKESENLMTAKQPDVYQARMAKVINTSQDEDSLRHLLSASKQGYPPPMVDSHGKEIGDQDYTVPSPPERDIPLDKSAHSGDNNNSNLVENTKQKFGDLLKHYSSLDDASTKQTGRPTQKSNQMRGAQHQRVENYAAKKSQYSGNSTASTCQQVDPSTNMRSPQTVIVSRPQLALETQPMTNAGTYTQTVSPQRQAVEMPHTANTGAFIQSVSSRRPTVEMPHTANTGAFTQSVSPQRQTVETHPTANTGAFIQSVSPQRQTVETHHMGNTSAFTQRVSPQRQAVETQPMFNTPAFTQTVPPPRLAVQTQPSLTHYSSTTTQTSPQADKMAPWSSRVSLDVQIGTDAHTMVGSHKEYEESSAQVSPPLSSPSIQFGLNSLLSDKDIREREKEQEDATRIISKWELEKEQREQTTSVPVETTKTEAVEVLSGHIRQYSENTAPMLHRLSNEMFYQQQLQKVNQTAPPSARIENNRSDRNINAQQDSITRQETENEPIYATIEEHQSNKNSKGSRKVLKEIVTSPNYVNMSGPNYMNIGPADDMNQTHPKVLYAEKIAREDRKRKGQEKSEKSKRGHVQEIPVPHHEGTDMLKTWHGYSNSYSNPAPKLDSDLYRIEEHDRHMSEGRAKEVNMLRYDMPSRKYSESKGLKRTTSEQIRPLKEREPSFSHVPNVDSRFVDHGYSSSMDQSDSSNKMPQGQRWQPSTGQYGHSEDLSQVKYRQSKKNSRSESYRERVQSDKLEFEQHAEFVRADKKRPLSGNYELEGQRLSMGSSSSDPELKKIQKQALLNFFQSKTGTIDGSMTSLVSSDEGTMTWDGSLQRSSRPSSISRDVQMRHASSSGQLGYQGLRRSDSVSSSQSRSGSTSSGGYSPNRFSWDRGDVFRPQSTSSMEKSPLSPAQHPQVKKLLRKHKSAMEMNVSGQLSPEEDGPRRRSSSSGVFEPNLPAVSGNINKSQYQTSHTSLPSDDEKPPLPPRNYKPGDDAPGTNQGDMRRNDPSWEQKNEWHEFNLWREKYEAQRNGYEQDWQKSKEKQTHDHNRNRSRGKSYENIYPQEDDAYTRQLREQSRRMSQNQPLSGPANYKREMVLTKAKSEIIKSKPVDTRPQPQETYLPSAHPKDSLPSEPVRPPKPRAPFTKKRSSPELPPPPMEETDIDAAIREEDNSLPPPPPPKDYPLRASPRDFGSPRSSPSSRSSPRDYPAEISFPPPPPTTSDMEDKGSQTDEDEIDDYPEGSYMDVKKKHSRNRYNGPGNYIPSPTSERPLLSTAPAILESAIKITKTRSVETSPAIICSPHSSTEHSPRSSPVPACAVQLIKSPRSALNSTTNTSYSQSPTATDTSLNNTQELLPPRETVLFKPIDSTPPNTHNLPPKGRRYSEQPISSKRSPIDSVQNRRQSMDHHNTRRSNDSLDRLPWVSTNSSISESTESLEGAFTRKSNENLQKSVESLNSTKRSTENLSRLSEKEINTKSGGSSPVRDNETSAPQTVLTIKHIRHKSQEELECELEAARLANQIKEQDSKLSKVLAPTEPPKTASDYMEGVVEIDPVVQHRRQSSAGGKSASPKSTSPKPSSDGRLSMTPTGEKFSDSPIPPTSPYWQPTPSSKNMCLVDDLSYDGDLNKKKEELAARIQKKLDALLQEKETLNGELAEVDILGNKVSDLVESRCTDAEHKKYKLYVDESEKVVKLLLKLSGWLANAENKLSSLPEDAPKDERDALLEKKDRFSKQHEDARALKEGIDKRRSQVSGFLENCFSDSEFDDFKHFTKMRLTLIWEMKDLDDSIQMGRDQLKELKKSMESH